MNWGLIGSLAPRLLIISVCVFVTNVVGSVGQMCFSDFTIPGTCSNPSYMPLHYTMTAGGLLVGLWAVFLYNIWTTDVSDDGESID